MSELKECITFDEYYDFDNHHYLIKAVLWIERTGRKISIPYVDHGKPVPEVEAVKEELTNRIEEVLVELVADRVRRES